MGKLKTDFNRVTEVELTYKNKVRLSERTRIYSSQDAFRILREHWDDDKIELMEEFKILLLDRRNNVLGISSLAKGGITGCMVDLRLAFATALKARATGMIISHNHPSGALEISSSDKALTKKFVQAGNVIDIPILDHIVVTDEGYASFADQGVLPEPKNNF